MFFFGRTSAKNYVRKYATDLRAIQMAHDIYQGANTDATRPPLMVMHGLLGTKKYWHFICNALKTKTSRKIINLDARNHGDSPHTTEHGTVHMSADIVQLMEQMKINKTALMGHSIGGNVMMYTALKHPELVERIVIVDVSPLVLPIDYKAAEKIFKAMRNLQVPKEMPMAVGHKYAKKEMKKTVDPTTVKFVLINLRKLPDGSFKWACNVDALYNSLGTLDSFMKDISGLEPYKGDVLFICGNKSSYMEPNSLPKIKKIFPKAEINWLDAGHLVHFEQPEKFLNLVVQFLK